MCVPGSFLVPQKVVALRGRFDYHCYMNAYLQSCMNVLDALSRYEVEYCLIGGLAVALHGIERFTKDLDIVVKLEIRNIENLRQALHSVFDDESIDEITFEALKQYAVIRYGTPDGYYIDVLGQIGEVFAFDDLAVETIEREGTQIKIASVDSLIKLKQDTIRLQDKLDVKYLQELKNQQKRDNAGT